MIIIENPVHRFLGKLADVFFKSIFYAGLFLGLWKKNKSNINDISPQKILIVETEPIGDVIISSGIYGPIRQKYPNAEISVIVGPWAKDVLKNNPFIKEIIIINCPWAYSQSIVGLKGFFGHINFIFAYLKIYLQLKKKAFDTAIDLRGDLRNILFFMFLPQIPYRISFGRTGGEYFLTKAVEFNAKEHEVEKNFTLLKYLDIISQEKKVAIYPSMQDINKVKSVLEQNNIVENSFICVIHPGAGKKVRFWINKRYAQIADYMAEKYNAKIILTGSKGERTLAGDIQKNMSYSAVNLAGELGILEMAALLKKTSLLICPDTSIMHLAATFSTPTVALFGPGDPAQVGAYQKNIRIVDKSFDCRPCIQKKCKIQNTIYGACMEAIEPKDVIEQIENLMSKK